MSVDRAPSGPAPFSLVFTANGTDTNGTIGKIAFNFGDGPVQDVTSGGGIGTKTASTQLSHTYNNPGTFQASVVLFDNDGAISSTSAACAQAITVTAPADGGGNGGTGGGNNGGGNTQPTPTIEAPGSMMATVGIVSGVVLTIIGGFFLLTLYLIEVKPNSKWIYVTVLRLLRMLLEEVLLFPLFSFSFYLLFVYQATYLFAFCLLHISIL